jgi:hypothetical protein
MSKRGGVEGRVGFGLMWGIDWSSVGFGWSTDFG